MVLVSFAKVVVATIAKAAAAKDPADSPRWPTTQPRGENHLLINHSVPLHVYSPIETWNARTFYAPSSVYLFSTSGKTGR